MKSKLTCYALWLLGGALGLHHLYLRRYRHAFLWLSTLGGFCGLGWVRETWRLSEYVDEYNAQYKVGHRKTLVPPFSFVRFGGAYLTGVLFGILMHGAIPYEVYTAAPWLHAVGFLGVAIGVHLVANVGYHTCSFRLPLMVLVPVVTNAYLTCIESEHFLSAAAVFMATAAGWGRKWKPQSRSESSCAYVTLVWLLCVVLYAGLWCSFLLHGVTITNKYGESVTLRDAARNFVNSPAWEDMKETAHGFYEELRQEGFEHAWRELMISLDPDGEDYAFKVLGIDSSATEKEITSAYRDQAKKWHPDRQKDPTKKAEAEKKFREINKAYEILSSIKARRSSNNLRSRTEF